MRAALRPPTKARLSRRVEHVVLAFVMSVAIAATLIVLWNF